MFKCYEVGKPYEEIVGHKESTIFDMDDAGCTLYIYFSKPTDTEIEQIEKGRIDFSMYVVEGIIFVLVKFGTLEWMDAPFTAHLAQNLSSIIEPDKTKGYACQIMLGDTATGNVKALRLVGLGHQYSMTLLDNIKEQMTSKSFSRNMYDAKIAYLYNMMTTRDMVRRSISQCKIAESNK